MQDSLFSSDFVEQPCIAEKTYKSYSVEVEISLYTTIISETQSMKVGEMAGASPGALSSD